MRQLTYLVLSTVLSAFVLVGAPGGAQAAEQPFDLYALKSPGLHVNSGSCRHVKVTAKTNAPNWVEDVDVVVDLWRGTNHVDSVWLDEVNGDTRTLSGSFFYCPHIDPLGKYRLGDSEVQYWDYDYDSGTFIDTSRGAMTVKQAVRARSFAATRDGARRTFSARLQYFAVGADSWTPYPKGTKVALQRRAKNGTGSWKWVDTNQVQARGRITFSVRAARVFQYRLVSRATRRSWNLATSPLTK